MKYYEKLKELIDNELESLSYFEIREIICENDDRTSPEYYSLEIKTTTPKEYNARFRCTKYKIEVEISETWKEVNNHTELAKNFWISLLS